MDCSGIWFAFHAYAVLPATAQSLAQVFIAASRIYESSSAGTDSTPEGLYDFLSEASGIHVGGLAEHNKSHLWNCKAAACTTC